jgi:NADPH:quinone reductase-like Zn-dependent oxidoreductase
MEEGQIKSVIDRRYSLEQVPAAHEYVETGRKIGNVVVTLKN